MENNGVISDVATGRWMIYTAMYGFVLFLFYWRHATHRERFFIGSALGAFTLYGASLLITHGVGLL